LFPYGKEPAYVCRLPNQDWPRLALLAGGAYVLLQPEALSPLPEPPALPE